MMASVDEIKFQTLLNAAPDGILIVAADGQIVIANAQAERLFGFGAGMLPGVAVDSLLPAALRARHVRHRANYAAAPHTRPMGIGTRLLARRADGTVFPVEVSLSAMQLPDAQLVTAIVRDISRQQQAADALTAQVQRLEDQRQALTARLTAVESAALQAARLAAVGQLAASVAHEINNPLYAARNSLHLLEQDLPEAARANPFLTIARDELARIAGIIERMREFYRPAPGEITSCALTPLLERTLTLVTLNARHQAVAVDFAPDPQLPPVWGSAEQLRQVFINLMLNAVEAMPDGGMLRVQTSHGPSVVVVEIADSGVGIPDDMLPRLFEPFFTNKPNGTGLGLSISAHIITQHEGQIEVERPAQGGTIFRVVLPRFAPDHA